MAVAKVAVVMMVVARVAVGVVTKGAVMVVCPGWVLVGSIMVRMNQAAK